MLVGQTSLLGGGFGLSLYVLSIGFFYAGNGNLIEAKEVAAAFQNERDAITKASSVAQIDRDSLTSKPLAGAPSRGEAPRNKQSSTLESRYNQALQAMMANIDHPERIFEFVQAAVAVNDLRGAIAALERILLLKPGLANIKLELGVLYLRLGESGLATYYIREALKAPDIPESVRVRAEDLLTRAEIATSRHVFKGLLSMAGRFDSNANAAPSTVRVFDPLVGQVIETTLQDEFTEQEDYSIQIFGDFRHRYRLDTQTGNELESNLLLFTRRYAESDEVNTVLADLDVGPHFYFGDFFAPDISLRPYISASYLVLDDDDFLSTIGGGVHIRKPFSTKLNGETYLEYEDLNFKKSDRRPTVNNRSGPQFTLGGELTYHVFNNTVLSGGIALATIDADKDFESFDEVSVTFSVRQYYEAPFRLTQRPWNSAVSARIRQSEYDDPDLAIDPNTTRDDTRQDYIFSTNIPLMERLALVLSAQYTDNDSNLPNNSFDNVSGSVGATWQF